MAGEVGARIVAEVTRQQQAAVGADWTKFDMWVPGKAEPQGSKRVGRHGRIPVILDANDKVLAPWKQRVALQASNEMRALGYSPVPPKVPVYVGMEFILPRLASAPKTRPHPPASTKPDLDKLIRSVFDALTGPVLHDDAQVIGFLQPTGKRRAEPDEEPGVYIVVERQP